MPMMPYNLIKPTYSPTFVLAETLESAETMMESSLSGSSSSSSSINWDTSSPSHLIDENLILSSTVSHLFSTLFPKPTIPPTTTSTSSSSSSNFSPTTIPSPSSTSILLSSITSSVTSSPSLSTVSPTGHHHHYHHHPVTPPLISTLPTNGILDFGDKFLREEQRCVALVPETYDSVISSLCGIAVAIGLVYILSGYRLFRSVLFLTGFLIVSSLTYGFIVSTSTPIPLYGTLIVSLSAGFLAGLVTLFVSWVGLMVLGFNLGTFIGTLIIISIHILSPHVDTLSPPQSIWITFSVIAGWGVIGAFSTLYFQKGCTILATCMFGSTLVIGGLDYFVENFNLFLWFWDNLKSNGNAMFMSTAYGIESGLFANTTDSGLFMCLISWILLMLWVILVCLGLFCQWCATGRGYYHSPSGTFTSSSSSHRNGTLDLVRIRAEESKTEQKQRKYRYLYQVRTAHGDVISQHYIQNFQKKLSPQLDHHNDSLRTYNSDLSHLTSYNQSESRTTTMSHLP